MKSRKILLHFFSSLPMVARLIVGHAWAQGGPAPQTLSWTGTPNEILTQNVAYQLGATASSGFPVTLRVDAGPAVLADGKISVSALGTVIVTAEQTGDVTYAAARLSRSFNVRHAVFSPVGGLALGGGRGVQVVGNYAYVADGAAGLQVIDVSNPASPVRVGGYFSDGGGKSVQVVGNRAYLADGSGGLRVIDVSDPAKPVQVGGVFTEGSVNGVQVVGNYAYVADGAGLQVIDVSNPANPVRTGGFNTSGYALAAHVVRNLAYVADENAGLQVIDVSNPANPVQVGGFAMGIQARDVQVAGNYAYVAYSGGLQVIDVSNPASPVLAGRYAIEGTWDPVVYGVQVVENYAYLTYSFGLQVIDVSNPANPVQVGGVATGSAVQSVQVLGNFVYVVDNLARFQILEYRLAYPQTLAWEGVTSEILALNSSHPLSATASSGLPVTLRVKSGPAVLMDGMITVTGPGNVWITAEQAGNGTYLPAPGIVRSFNVRRIALTRVGEFDTSGFARSVQVVGNYAYLADDAAGLQVIDISNPTSPVRTGGFNTSGFARDVQVVGNYAYLADDAAGLQVINISNLASPVRTGGFDTSFAESVQVVGNYAYLAEGQAGLQVIDVSNPAKPVPGGRFAVGEVFGVQVVGNYAYLADGQAGLQVIDVSNPTRLEQVGGYVDSTFTNGYGYARGVQVAGNYAYLADDAAGLQVIDVSNPTSPMWVGGYRTNGLALAVQVVGNYAYVAGEAYGLQVIDVSNPASPVLVGEYLSIGQASDVQVVGNRAYVAGGEAGLQIIELRSGFPQTLELHLPAEIPLYSSPIVSAVTVDSGLPLTMSVVSGPATVMNNQLVLTGLGPVTLRAEQAGDVDHLPAVAQWTLTVVYRETLSPISIELAPGGVRLRFTATPSRTYTIERAQNIRGPWITLATPTAPLDGMIEYFDTNSLVDAAFYRTREP